MGGRAEFAETDQPAFIFCDHNPVLRDDLLQVMLLQPLIGVRSVIELVLPNVELFYVEIVELPPQPQHRINVSGLCVADFDCHGITCRICA